MTGSEMKNPPSRSVSKVFIGMPVYNAEAVVEKAIRALLRQTFDDFRIFISDNCSQDATEEICRRLAEEDGRIEYHRHPSNLGALRNFQHVLDRSEGEYFMWAAADDFWEPRFIRDNLSWLEAHGDYVGSICAASNGGNTDPERAGSTSIDDEDADSRIRRFVRNPGANSRFYSLFRRSALDGLNLLDFDHLAGDWSAMVLLLTRGKLKCLDGPIGFIKSGSGVSSDRVKLMDASRRAQREYVIPYYFYTRYVLENCSFWKVPKRRLLKLNFRAVKGYFRDKRRASR